MEFKNSMSLLFSHPQYILKIFVYLVICVCIVAGISCAVVIPVYKHAMTYADVESVFAPVWNTISRYMEGNAGLRAVFNQFMTFIVKYFEMVYTHPLGVFASILIPIGIYFLYSFLTGLVHYPVAYIVNNIMSSDMKMPLASSMLMNIKVSAKFSAAKMLILFPIDLCAIIVLGVIGIFLNKVIGLFIFPILIVLFVVYTSARSLLVSAWLPRMLYHPEERVFVAFKKSFPMLKRNRRSVMQAFLLLAAISFCIATALALPTYGLIYLALPSVYYFVLRAIELIGYYKVKGYKFYTDSSTVIDTTEYGYRPENEENAAEGESEGENN